MSNKYPVKKLFTMKGKYTSTVTYEYRGCQYEVEYSNCWTYCITPAHIQHRDAQEKIDKALDNPVQEKELRYEDTAQAGIDYFFKMLEEV